MTYLYIAIAGFIGAALRYSTGELFFRPEAGFPWGTLTVNIVGTFLLAWFTFRATGLSEKLKKAIGTGMLGSFTTFSALSVETVSLIETEAFLSALGYIAVSFLGGWIAAVLGSRFAGRGRGA